MKKQESKTQKNKFIKIAKELGCDESEAAFNAKLKKLATQKPKKRVTKK